MSTAAYKARAILGNEAAGSYVPTGNTGVNEFWDFLGGAVGTPFHTYKVGTGVVSGSDLSGIFDGSVDLAVSADDDLASIYLSTEVPGSEGGDGYMFFGTEEITTIQSRIRGTGFSSLNPVAFKIGLGTSYGTSWPNDSTGPGDEASFVVDLSISDNWMVVDHLNQFIVTDIPYVDQDITYLRIDYTPTALFYYIDNELVETVTITTDITNVSIGLGAILSSISRVGTSAASVKLDAIKFVRKFLEPRVFA